MTFELSSSEEEEESRPGNSLPENMSLITYVIGQIPDEML
jgi:hypothetical protein